MDYNKIELLLKLKKLQQQELIKYLDVTKSGFYYMIEHKSMSVSILEKLSKFFEVPIGYWFEEEYNVVKEPMVAYKNASIINDLKDEKNFLKDEIKFLREQLTRAQEECCVKPKKTG